jgi:hypothetical protein
MGRQGWLVELGAGDRLQHASIAGLAPVAHWQGEHSIAKKQKIEVIKAETAPIAASQPTWLTLTRIMYSVIPMEALPSQRTWLWYVRIVTRNCAGRTNEQQK